MRFSSQSSSCAFTFSCISKNSALSPACLAAVSANSTLQTSLRSSFIVTVFTSSSARSLRVAFLCAFLFAAVKIGDGASQHPRQFRQFVCAGHSRPRFPLPYRLLGYFKGRRKLRARNHAFFAVILNSIQIITPNLQPIVVTCSYYHLRLQMSIQKIQLGSIYLLFKL